MKQIVFMFLLLYWNTQSAQSEIFNQSVAEGSDAFLYCEHKGKVVWSKARDGQRQTILTKEENGEIVKYIDDPHNRYSVLSDLSLHINKVSLSDSGIYYCNNITVNLIVTASVTPKSTVSSQSGHVKESTSTQSNPHPKFTSTVTPKSTLSSRSGRVKESTSTQPNTQPKFTSTVIPKSTVSSQSVSVKESTSTQSNTQPKFPSTGSIGVIVAVCGVVFVALILLILACIKRKAAITNKKKENIYETVDDGDSTAQPVPPQKQNDIIYYLAGDPNIVHLGQSKEIADHTYTLISESKSKENLTDQAQDETLYSTIK
ncbi:uncharacterized protein LOC127650537 isoform X2 [Xyrauchen texanus]|uniref:uncharacterized protein LOC127650537 isoform X2 n=1 Tax=Xyrauchen texanus TaxID=154827 RepID=UPI00224299A1|nr:uncharacterized protein LOC127650537 isoform X2 [Xyrauchen texanus]